MNSTHAFYSNPIPFASEHHPTMAGFAPYENAQVMQNAIVVQAPMVFAADDQGSFAMSPVKVRKPKTRCACVPCVRAKTACEERRPCRRCIRLNLQHSCVNRPEGPHRKKFLTDPAPFAVVQPTAIRCPSTSVQPKLPTGSRANIQGTLFWTPVKRERYRAAQEGQAATFAQQTCK
ncbi:Zn(2)-C6 fungal-type domain-containing protein [Plasmodiophora brassicae]|uniref:Zn(2)-C6 fungal-type domain-containing protein n=1 Tax=Plasmodiophora brassicae TaxID=37360 RepID=A0A0G4J8W2_PLABS|nr:hypothetical protein PBRA_003422 [Plasmodiophora brassicae]